MRFASIGVGARSYLPSLVTEYGGRVTVAADVSARGRERAREQFPGARVFASHESIDADDVDAAFVLTPDHTHADIAIDLLERGIAVYLEKPMATSVEDCDRILEAAFRSRTPLYVGHNMRHMPVVRLMREIIKRGEIGEVQAVWCRHFVGHGGDFYFHDWHAERSKGVSLLLQKGVHDLDVIHWLSGAAARDVSAMGDLMLYGRIPHRRDNSDRLIGLADPSHWPPLSQVDLNPVVDVEDVSMVNLRLHNGVLGSYMQCHFTPDYWRNYTVIGTEGRLENFGDTAGGVVRVWNRRSDYSPDGDTTYPVSDGEGSHGGADLAIIGEFVRFLAEGQTTDTSPVEARDAVAAAVAATESLRHGSAPQHTTPLAEHLRSYFAAIQGLGRS